MDDRIKRRSGRDNHARIPLPLKHSPRIASCQTADSRAAWHGGCTTFLNHPSIKQAGPNPGHSKSGRRKPNGRYPDGVRFLFLKGQRPSRRFLPTPSSRNSEWLGRRAGIFPSRGRLPSNPGPEPEATIESRLRDGPTAPQDPRRFNAGSPSADEWAKNKSPSCLA